jgi:hypothetical protein
MNTKTKGVFPAGCTIRKYSDKPSRNIQEHQEKIAVYRMNKNDDFAAVNFLFFRRTGRRISG